VDDSPAQARTTAALLASVGYRPARSASDWARVRALLAEQPADLMVLDVHMGGQVSGDAMVPQLKRFPGCGAARIVLYSAIKSRDLEITGRRCGADAAVAKGDNNAFLSTCTRLVPVR
jgi:CheY-like chemotaxis protein